MHSFLRRFRIFAFSVLSLAVLFAIRLEKLAGPRTADLVRATGRRQQRLLSIEELLPPANELLPSRHWPGWTVRPVAWDEKPITVEVTWEGSIADY